LALSIAILETVASQVTDMRPNDVLPCFVVISNELPNDSKGREIRIMMSKGDITEANFVKLQHHFSSLYLHAAHFTIRVHTSLNFTLGNYPVLGDVERLQAGLPAKAKPSEKEAQGIIIHTEDADRFGYKREGGDIRDITYIHLRGDIRNCHGCKSLNGELRGETGPVLASPAGSQRMLPAISSLETLLSMTSALLECL
jgi:hypothetical protein